MLISRFGPGANYREEEVAGRYVSKHAYMLRKNAQLDVVAHLYHA